MRADQDVAALICVTMTASGEICCTGVGLEPEMRAHFADALIDLANRLRSPSQAAA